METRFKGMTPQAPAVSFIHKEWSVLHMENLEGADWVTDRQKVPQHPSPFFLSAPPVFKVTDG